MSSVAKNAAWGTATALVVLVAANGVEFFESLRAGWVFVTEVTAKMPLGLGSFLLAWLLGACLMGFLRRWIPVPEHRDLMHLRMFFIEISSATAAFLACWLQTRTLLGMILGITAGLSISIIYRVLAAAGSALVRKVSEQPEQA